mgnify:FL=1|jgi:hypothetical protein
MSYELTGTIKSIAEKQVFESGFQKVKFVVTTNDEKYPQDISFEIVQDKVDDFIKYNKVGASVDVSFNIRGNEYNGNNYNTLSAWKVFKSGANAPATDIGVPTEELATNDLPF